MYTPRLDTLTTATNDAARHANRCIRLFGVWHVDTEPPPALLAQRTDEGHDPVAYCHHYHNAAAGRP